MPLVKVRDLLKTAQEQNTAILAFDAADYNTIFACIKGAEAVNKPVIVMLYPTMQSIFSFGAFAQTVIDLAKSSTAPIGLHLDHCTDASMIYTAIQGGFSSVMADGSAMPFDENVAFTKQIVDVAKAFDVDVEGEIGHVGQIAAGFDYSDKESFTLPEEAAKFAELTGVASMAVAFGSCHGVYKSTPNLDLDRLKEIDKATDTPLVLHGGSGIPQDQLEKAFTMGINKFNIGTEFFILNEKLIKEYYTKPEGEQKPFGATMYVREGLTKYMAEKLDLCKIKL